MGLALETGGIGKSAQRFFAPGGLGILIGDGRLDHYDREDVVEAYYSAGLWKACRRRWITSSSPTPPTMPTAARSRCWASGCTANC